MREPEIITVADLLFWSYANLGMAQKATYDRATRYTQLHFIIRNKLWSGLRKGTTKPASVLKDLRAKMKRPDFCAYCGGSDHLSADHLVPTVRGGRDSAENFILACRSCNSSKGGRDVLDWYRQREEFPPLFILRVYLKEAIHYCQQNGLMDGALGDAGPVPFCFDAIPTQFPAPDKLVYYVSPVPPALNPQ